MEENNPTCCFCGKPCENEWGNNPYPTSKEENDRCCDKCNLNIVIPERIKEFEEEKELI